MINAAKQAQLLINQTDSQNVISLERLFGLHTSLNYFCCHSQSEKETIVQVLRKFQWTPKILTYDVFGCNLDHDGVTIYLHAQPNSVGQRTLFTMIREIEQAIENAGVPLINKRHQSFHCTLARVNHNYPVDDIVKKINGTIDFGTVTFNWFILDGHIFYATNNKTIT
jgi:2'-5' RNA ligase